MTGLLVLGIAVLAGVIFIAYRRLTDGRVEVASSGPTLGLELNLGQRATLVQFSSEMCAPCKPTREMLATVADDRAGVAHVDLDVAEHFDLVTGFAIRRTPTVLVLDGSGQVRHRITGVPRLHELNEALDEICSVRA